MKNMLPLILILICFLLIPPSATCFNNQTDLLSLLAFKSSLEDPLGALTSWNETIHFCSWRGITCSRRRVVEINLSSQGLVGSLSPHLGNLSLLTTIILQNNTFQGQIPQEIGLLRRLQTIFISNNSFVGAIPKALSQCPNLVHLNLIDNKLSGWIPMELGFISKLVFLGLSKNNFSGTIPPSLGNITSLENLSLLSCGLQGNIPESLASLGRLEFLQLGDNNFTGFIPSRLFNTSAGMRHFSVYGNQLEGLIPSTIGLDLPNLRKIHLSQNQFSGLIPPSLSNASLLEDIILDGNSFAGRIPRGFGSLTRLQRLNLRSNLLADDISFISWLRNSSELLLVELSDNLFTGSLPNSVSNLSIHLTRLSIRANRGHGEIPSGIGKLINLTSVDFSDNYLEGSFPVGVTELSNLHELHLGRNRFTNELPSSMGNLSLLNRLYLNENKFSGNPPSGIVNCTDLLELDLSHNRFSGFIPPEIMGLSSVSIVFNLSYNELDGLIPYEVGSLRNLVILDLSNNRLSGVIPNSLSYCTSLQQLHLEGNSLEGEIPYGMNALMGLQELDLSRNSLSGRIPSFLEMLDLQTLNLSFNRLQGSVPITGVFGNKTSISVDGNTGLCGGILELRLPSCPKQESDQNNLAGLLEALPVGTIFLTLGALFTCMTARNLKFREIEISAVPATFSRIQIMRLSYADLLKDTAEFSRTNLVGVGRFGSVFKGKIEDGETEVAVKVLNLRIRGALESFTSECNALKHARHRNLLKLLSVCESIDFQGNDFKALIYEYKANGSLEKWLYQEEEIQTAETSSLDMIQRFNIAIDIAQAIEYLHFGSDLSIVHGDLKPSNILLDHDMTACVGDFGLARIISDINIQSHESCSSAGVKGTLGYVAPEYATGNAVSTQGDVYSYGILLLEMFTNKRPTDEAFKDHVNLHSFVCNALPYHVMEIIDPRIVRQGVNSKFKNCMTAILGIGTACSNPVAGDRMLIADVVREMRKIRAFYLAPV